MEHRLRTGTWALVLGSQTLLLQLQPFEAEMRRFARHPMPRPATLQQAERRVLASAGAA